jgi:hypothetical protein
MIGRALRAPAVHFLLAGGLLFAARAWWSPPAAEHARPRILVSANDVERLRDTWAAQHGVPPDAGTERQLIEDAIDEEVLHREALAAGLDRRDRMVRTRLVQLASFLGEASESDGEAALGEARRLGLEERDVVIRRHLVQMMRLALAHLDAADMPDEQALAAFLDAHTDLFQEAPRVRLTHVYLSRDRHGAALSRDAARLLDELRRAGAAPETAGQHGDVFLRGAHPAPATPGELAALFGPDFAAAIEEAPAGEWFGPVRSPYGLHLVWIHERSAARVPALADVRAQVLHRVLQARGEEQLRSRLATLRSRYDVAVER